MENVSSQTEDCVMLPIPGEALQGCTLNKHYHPSRIANTLFCNVSILNCSVLIHNSKAMKILRFSVSIKVSDKVKSELALFENNEMNHARLRYKDTEEINAHFAYLQ